MQTESPSPLERLVVGRLVRSVFMGDRSGGPWTPPADLRWERVSFEGNTGARVAGHWFPAESPRGAVVLAHPDKRYGKHWFVRAGWVRFLHESGYDVLTFDFPGYGDSVGPARYYHEDVVAAARFTTRWAGGFPVHVVGVSMGAFAVANAIPRLGFVTSVVLESPYPSFNEWYGRGPYRAVMDAFDILFPRSSAAIQADRNVRSAAVERILVVTAGEDEVTPPRLTKAIADAAPRERTVHLVVPGARHLEPFERSEEYRQAVLKTLG